MTMKQTKKQFIGISYDELLSENARLREELEAVGIAAYSYGRGDLKAENAKLRELAARMAEALGIDCEWADPNWCKSNCVLEFGCWPEEERTDIRCPAWAAMRELGVEVD